MRILALAREDLRLTLRDRSAFFWMFIAPILWVFLFGAVNQSSDAAQIRIDLMVVRQDPSDLAEKLVAYLEAENFLVREVKPGDPIPSGDEAPARTLTIPAGFAEAIGKREKVTLDLREGSRANPQGTFAAQVALHKAIVRLLAGEAFGGLDPKDDAVRVNSSWAVVRAIPTGYYQTIPGNLVMFVLLAATTSGAALLAMERQQGILRRLAASPLSRSELILGKLLGRVAIAIVQTAVFVALGSVAFRIEWGSSPAGLAAVLLCLVLCAGAIGLLGGAIFSSPEAGSGVAVVAVLLMSAVGGCWWPAEVMPRWLQVAGHIFPAAWAMDGLHEIISWGGGLGDVLLPIAILSLYALATGTLAVRRLKISG